MSAHMCTEEHISILAEYAVARRLYRPANPSREVSAAEQCARMLFDANAKSLHARYGDPDDMYGPFGFRPGLSPRALMATPVAIIKAAQCFSYQACEYDGWATSEASHLMAAIVDDCIHRLPGYETASWGAP